ncbi:hypothetical protein [Novilysobacter avium]|uniref:Anti sigma-E protein RseA N-terminal domain-containing protein n=1 Tax=Novilysobacter avium TaxID=2781023 RepID=A0A7S6ZU21_9GAMM|nr:hypothetical protein [Lysobacter avium]QOW21575.1 hypothetical protein INQ42_10045 [Lysobacter avium]
MNRYASPPTADPRNSPQSRFDAHARECHADALAHVSPHVLSRLQQARRAAALGAPRRHSRVWAWSGSAAVLALALGVGVQFQRAPDSTQGASVPLANTADLAAGQAVAALDEVDSEVSGLLAALDENPDFYLWLAANDGALSPPAERYP